MRICKDKYSYVFLDEIQNCKDFEKAVDSLFIQPNVDVYITGSNADMRSGELATLLSGRYITIDMLPLSFKEYYTAVERTKTPRECFKDYLRFGSFPYVSMLEHSDAIISPYIDGIYNTILIKDVASRIGSPISAKKISDIISASGGKISVNTANSYLRALMDSYIFYKVDHYDIKGRQYLKTLGKYYLLHVGAGYYFNKFFRVQ